MNNLIEIFNNSSTIYGLAGVIIASLITFCSLLLKRSLEKIDAAISTMDKKLEKNTDAWNSMDKQIAVQNEKNSGVFQNLENILNQTRLEFKGRFEMVENQVFRNNKTRAIKRRKVNV